MRSLRRAGPPGAAAWSFDIFALDKDGTCPRTVHAAQNAVDIITTQDACPLGLPAGIKSGWAARRVSAGPLRALTVRPLRFCGPSAAVELEEPPCCAVQPFAATWRRAGVLT